MAGKVTIDLSNDNDLLVSASIIAKILKISRQRVSVWAKDGMPSVTESKRPLYPVRACIEWAIARGKIDIDFETDDLDRTQLPPDLRDKLASAELKEEKLKLLRGETGPIAEMEKIAYNIGDFVKNSMLSIPSRVAAILAKESDQHKIETLLRQEIVSVMQDMSDQMSQIKDQMKEAAQEASK